MKKRPLHLSPVVNHHLTEGGVKVFYGTLVTTDGTRFWRCYCGHRTFLGAVACSRHALQAHKDSPGVYPQSIIEAENAGQNLLHTPLLELGPVPADEDRFSTPLPLRMNGRLIGHFYWSEADGSACAINHLLKLLDQENLIRYTPPKEEASMFYPDTAEKDRHEKQS